MSDAFSAFVYIFEGGSYYIHVIVGIYSAGDCETKWVKAVKAIFMGHRITVGKDITDFTSTDTGFQVELYG